ncbi:MAG: bL35 family ribosomal protein [Candidatus Buchananbacteria bacterium]
MKLKTRKTIAKRFKVSKNGKLLRRKGGQGHFNARESSNTTRNKRRDEVMAKSHTKNIKSLISSQL